MYKIAISGGPNAGKTTLWQALQPEFPEAHFVPEPATTFLEDQERQQKDNPHHELCAPWIDYTKFGPAVTALSLKLEADIPPETRLTFLDRSLVDTVAYSRLNNFERFIPIVEPHLQAARYTMGIICQPVGSYTETNIRRETPEEALQTHRQLQQAYNETGMPVLTLPAFSVADRVAVIRDVVANLP